MTRFSPRNATLSPPHKLLLLYGLFTHSSHTRAHTQDAADTHTLIFTLTFTHNVCSLRVQVRRALSFWVRSNNSVPPSCMHDLPASILSSPCPCTLHSNAPPHSAQRHTHTHWQLRTPTHVSALSPCAWACLPSLPQFYSALSHLYFNFLKRSSLELTLIPSFEPTFLSALKS